ncbi:MAG: hypothetical protein ACRDCV_10145 [Plesiomonas shigelloides]
MNNKTTAADMIGILVNHLNKWPTVYQALNIDFRTPVDWEWVITPERSFITNGDSVITKDVWLMAKAEKEMEVNGPRIIPADEITTKSAATAIQPAPSGSGNPILGMVLADLTNRALEGKEKYGEPLKANNGRKPLWDAYQEALDLCMYLRQMIEEQKQ